MLRYARANTNYSTATAVLCDAIQMRDVKQVGVISYYYTRYCSAGHLSVVSVNSDLWCDVRLMI
jgi:hypothetical protein